MMKEEILKIKKNNSSNDKLVAKYIYRELIPFSLNLVCRLR